MRSHKTNKGSSIVWAYTGYVCVSPHIVGWTQLQRIREVGRVELVPVLLGAIFRTIGTPNLPGVGTACSELCTKRRRTLYTQQSAVTRVWLLGVQCASSGGIWLYIVHPTTKCGLIIIYIDIRNLLRQFL